MSKSVNGNAASNKVDRADALASMANTVALHDEAPSKSRKIFSPLMLTVFFVALLLALIAGVLVYQHVTNVQTQTNAEREGIGLICNVVRANDSHGCVKAGNGPEGTSLVVVQQLESGNYESRFYEYQGNIVEEYTLAGNPYTPEKATQVTESSTFQFTYSKGVLSITTDQGTAEVALRYMQGGE
jgi:hypothetical protein